jgi:hypothetical protein
VVKKEIAMRKAKVIPHFMHYLDKTGEDTIPLVLLGHLVAEALLVEVVQLKRPGDKA